MPCDHHWSAQTRTVHPGSRLRLDADASEHAPTTRRLSRRALPETPPHGCIPTNYRQAPGTRAPEAGNSQGFNSMGWRGVTRGVTAFAKIGDSSAFVTC